jgi:hypothetical protein
MLFVGGDKLYFHVFTFRESLWVKSTNLWSVKPLPLKCGGGYGVQLADLFQEKSRTFVQPLLATALTEREDHGYRR